MSHWKYHKYLDYLLLNIGMLLILIFTLGVNSSIFKYPIGYRGDMLQVFIYMKMIITGDLPFYTYATSQYIGLPFDFTSADFPSPVASNFLFVKFLSLFSSNVFFVTNMYIIISYFMIINVMFFVLRKLEVNNYLAIAISILYALVPYHQMRISHTWFINYFLLPISIYYLLLLWKSKPLFFIKKAGDDAYKFDFSSKNFIIIAVLAVFSVWNFYYAFFFVLFAIAATISAFYYRRNRYHLFSGLLMIFFVTAPFVINLIPYKVYQYENGKNAQFADRKAYEAEIYGLKIAQMLLPIDGHNIAKLANIKNRYSAAPLINENGTATLGIIGAIGFLIMTIFMLLNERVLSTIKKLSIISYTAVIIATIGGYSSLFALLITPQIRGYSRISIYISAIALIVFALALTKVMRHYSLKKMSTLLLSLLILFIGIYDQIPSYVSFDRAINTYKNIFISDKIFIQEIEKAMIKEDDKKVFQLPHMSSPESGTINGVGEYEQAIGFLHSDQIKWSYGAVRGRKSGEWVQKLLELPLESQVQILKSSGFNGIYIDRRGYKDNARSLEGNLSKILGIEPMVNKTGAQSFFKMQATGNKPYDFSLSQ